MLRLAIILLILCLVFRWAFGEWPWSMLSGKPSREQTIRDARKLLGVNAASGRDEIIAAHRRLMASVHPDKGGSSAEVHRANSARDLLLEITPEKEH